MPGPRREEQRELRVERPVHGGRCVARPVSVAAAGDGAGPVVLVAGAIPGEVVRARVTVRQGVAFGDTLDVLEASADRVPAPAHPGLDLGHVAPQRQLLWKHEVLMDAGRRAGVAWPAEVPAVVPSPAAWGYRGAIQPAVAGDRGAGTVVTPLGYRRPGAHDVVALDADPTANAACAAAWDALRAQPLPRGVVEVAIRGNDAGEALVALIASGPAREALDAAHALVRAGVGDAEPTPPRGASAPPAPPSPPTTRAAASAAAHSDSRALGRSRSGTARPRSRSRPRRSASPTRRPRGCCSASWPPGRRRPATRWTSTGGTA